MIQGILVFSGDRLTMKIIVYRFTYAFSIVLLGITPLPVHAQSDANTNFEPAVVIAAILILAVVVFFLVREQQRRKNTNDQEIKQKIHELRSRGQELHVNREETLTPEDELILKKYVQHTSIAALIVLGILGLVFLVFMEGIGMVVGVIVLALIYPIRTYMYKDLKRALEEGKKQVIRGIITDRFTTTTGSHKSRTTHHWLLLGEHKFEVTSAKYAAYAVGDAAEFHTTDYPKGKVFIISDEKLEGAGLR
jgi:membrane protein implicated in regulation of membrane protease activity